MGGGIGAAMSSSADDSKGGGAGGAAKAKATDEPVLDLNSILRGNKVKVVQGAEAVADAYALVVRVLDRTRSVKGMDLRTAISQIAPKAHPMHAPVTALSEFVCAPATSNKDHMMDTGKRMLRLMAVANQENGRREFTSRHVACTLGATPEELGLWTRLDLDHQHGVALTATLAKQTDKAPAQYQFKHLSFQEGLYAEHLLMLVEDLQARSGGSKGWSGWENDKSAADFLNNR